MAFSNWGSYTDLLDKLSAVAPRWSDATDFTQFDDQLRKNCGDLVEQYAVLCGEMVASGGYDDRNLLYQDIRTAVLSRSTAAGERQQDQPDPTQQHYDPARGRWRRLNARDNEFEFCADDGVWERRYNDTWHRFHTKVRKWLPYDAPSGTWWYADKWQAHDSVGVTEPPADPFGWVTSEQSGRFTSAWGEGWRTRLGTELDGRWGSGWAANPVEHRQFWLTGLIDELLAPPSVVEREVDADEDEDEIDFAELAEESVEETIAELEDEDEPWTPEERAEIVAAVRANLEAAGRE